MPSITAEPVSWETERAELQAVLHSHLFARSPTLTHLLSYLCEKTFAGESAQIKEYSVGLDVFDRRDSFDQDTDSIVRVQANRLRKRLAEYYASEGATHPVHITIPIGSTFQRLRRSPTCSRRRNCRRCRTRELRMVRHGDPAHNRFGCSAESWFWWC